LTSYRIIKAISDYQALFPEVTFDVMITDRQPDLVGEGFDVSIVLAESLTDSTFVSQRLGTTHGILCASPGYLAKHGTPQELGDLVNHRCIALADYQPLPKKWVLQGADGHASVVQLHDTITVNAVDALNLALVNGMGIGLQPYACARHSLDKAQLVHILPTYKSKPLHFYAIYSSRRYLDAKIKTWVSFLSTLLGNAPSAITHCELTPQTEQQT
jgi:DNA-binding transcriptional LysR family regulator